MDDDRIVFRPYLGPAAHMTYEELNRSERFEFCNEEPQSARLTWLERLALGGFRRG